MANARRDKLIKIYGVTIGEGRCRPYGYGREKVNGIFVEYVHYYIEDLIALIKNQNLEKRFIEGIGE